MHPITNPRIRLTGSKSEAYKRKEKSAQTSALQVHHAQCMAGYIKEVFLIGELLGEGVEPAWKLGGNISKDITSNKWTIFQEYFMHNWSNFAERNSHDSFWLDNHPAFHAYDYGANIPIEVTDSLEVLAEEIRTSVTDDSDSSESEVDMQNQENQYTQRPPAVTRGHEMDNILQDLYSGGLQELLTELGQKYILDYIGHISYALAVNINCLDSKSPDPDNQLSYCMLADRNIIAREYQNTRDMTFYPMAFHPAYGNFSSPKPPRFLSHILDTASENMRYENDGADVLSYGYFQGYSNIKRAIRHAPDDLLVTKGIATAALALPDSEAKSSAWIRKKQQRFLLQLQGDDSSDGIDISKPFARERQRLKSAIEEDEFAFRMEQIISLDVHALVHSRRNFQTILRPIFQLMRFYLKEVDQYTHILRCFRPAVFPGIMCSFSRVFELAMDEMYRRYTVQGSKGLEVGCAEGVAALDRLGNYCFTGAPTALMPSVLKPLGTMDSIQNGAWPYICSDMLDLQQRDSAIDVFRWPRATDGRPIFMQLSSLAFHFGLEVAASRHTLLWFRDLGAQSIRGVTGAIRFLDDLFQKLWMPQTVIFISRQIFRRIAEYSGATSSREELKILEQERLTIEAWSGLKNPFTWR
jgi:hypothetical protein